mgnify:CR=1 FL=1
MYNKFGYKKIKNTKINIPVYVNEDLTSNEYLHIFNYINTLRDKLRVSGKNGIKEYFESIKPITADWVFMIEKSVIEGNKNFINLQRDKSLCQNYDLNKYHFLRVLVCANLKIKAKKFNCVIEKIIELTQHKKEYHYFYIYLENDNIILKTIDQKYKSPIGHKKSENKFELCDEIDISCIEKEIEEIEEIEEVKKDQIVIDNIQNFEIIIPENVNVYKNTFETPEIIIIKNNLIIIKIYVNNCPNRIELLTYLGKYYGLSKLVKSKVNFSNNKETIEYHI